MAGQIVRARTKTGSVYRFDQGAMTWERESRTETSGRIFSEKSKLRMWPTLEIGRNVLIVTESFEANGPTAIRTSPIVTVSEEL